MEPVKCSTAAKYDLIIQNVFCRREGKVGSREQEEIRKKWAVTRRKKYGIIFEVLQEFWRDRMIGRAVDSQLPDRAGRILIC